MIRSEMLCPSWPQRPLGDVVEFLDHLRRPIRLEIEYQDPTRIMVQMANRIL